MASTLPLVAQALVQLASAVLYLWVGRIVLERHVEAASRRANTLFGVWWVALGLIFLLTPIFSAPARFLGHRDLALATTLLNVTLLLAVVAVWGLVYYLIYLYTGSARAFWPITGFYVILAGTLLYLVAWLDPSGFDASGAVTFGRDRLSGLPAVAVGAALSLPVFLAAIAYGSLFFRVPQLAQRYRVALVSGAFILQFGWSLLSTLLHLPARFPNSVALAMLSNALGILAASAVLLAFRPPRAIRTRLGIPGPGGA